DAATQTFRGTPGNAQVGTLALRITVTDDQGSSASSEFMLTVANTNDVPEANTPVDDRAVNEDQPLLFALPWDTFRDIDAGDSLSYTATLTNGTALPSWLHFDAATQTFRGTPGNAQVGTLALRVVATDRSGASIGSDFVLTVVNVNDAPVLARSIEDYTATAGEPLRFELPPATFDDADAAEQLTYQASLADGSALPDWLRFDPLRQVFVADPQATDVGRLVVRVTATDASGASAQGLFTFTVAEAPAEPQPESPPMPAESPAAPPPPTGAGTTAPPPQPAAAPRAPTAPVPAAPPPALVQAAEPAVAPLATPQSMSAMTEARGPSAPVGPGQSGRLSSRADAVLAGAVVPQYADLRLTALNQLLHSDDLLRRLDELQRQFSESGELRHHVMASSLAVTGGMTIGYVVWLVRGGVLVSSMLSALPAWQMIDPLPVLTATGNGARRQKSAAADDPELERLFDEHAGRTGPEADRLPVGTGR
ncbi:MAG: putative Ig domain-containing protein, partial [Vitreoscilla sp.]|nr:putative Ig domain-containing protein [Vitreoscilla sp.]